MSVTAVNAAFLAAALPQTYRPRTIRTFNGRSVLLRTLEKRKGGGKNVAWTWEGQGAIAENYADGADVVNYGADSLNNAVLNWAMYRDNFLITDYAASVAGSAGQRDLINLAGRNFENGNRKLSSTINSEGYGGAGTGTLICGLDIALSDSNTYAGVDRTQSANAGFRSKVFDGGLNTDPTIDVVRGDVSAIYDTCGETPALGLMPTGVYNKFASKFTELRRFNQEVSVGSQKVMLNGSVDAIEIDGCMFFKDKDCTPGSIYYLNPDYVRFEYLPFLGMEEMMQDYKDVSADDGYGAMPLGMLVKPLSATGAAEKITMEVQLQLVVEKPNACGRRVNVAF